MVLGMTQLLDPPSGAGAGAPQPGPSVLDGLAAAAAGLADAWQSPVWPLGSEQLTDALDQMVELHRQAEAVYLRLLGEVDSRGIPLIEGASNTKSWLRERHRLSPGQAKADVAAAQATLPERGDLVSLGQALAAQGVGLALAAVGFAGASVALLRMTNDEFDLPPIRPIHQ